MTTDLKTLPEIQALVGRNWSPDLERLVLAAALNLSAGFGATLSRCDASDFFDPLHAALFTEIADRRNDGLVVDAALMREVVEKLEAEGYDGARSLLAQIAALPVLPANVKGHADELRTLSRRRRLMESALAAVTDADRADDVDGVLSHTISSLEALVSAGKARTRAEVLRSVAARLEKPPVIYPTGLPSLDAAMGGGLEPGRVYAFAGKGKSGKSLLAGTVSHHLNQRGVKHAYVALEMGAEEIETRKIAHDLKINSMALRGHVHTQLLGKVGQYSIESPDNVIYIDMPEGKFHNLKSEIISAKHRHRCTGVIFDYWQLIGGRDRTVSEEEHLRSVAQWLASAAKRLKIWIICLAQLTDDGEATAASRTGLNRNCDQLYFIRSEPDSPDRWLEMKASRFTPVADIGSINCPAFTIQAPGPHFRDLGA